MSERDEFEAWWQRGEWNVAAKDLAWKDMCRMAFHAGRAPQAVPEGWKLVPVEPTREMWAAFNKLDDEMAAGSYDGTGCSFEQGWNCMLAAAPQPSPDPKEPEHAHDWRFSLQDHVYKCDCGATRGDFPFGPATFKD